MDKPTGIGIVVSRLQIVQIRFRVEIIPSVPERVHRTDAVGIRQDGAVAPRRSRIASIAVGGDLGSSVVVYRDNVSKEVFFEEIPVERGFSVGCIPVTHPDRTAGLVVEVN